MVLQLNLDSYLVKKDKNYCLSTRTERQNIDPLEVSTDRPLIWAACSDIHLKKDFKKLKLLVSTGC